MTSILSDFVSASKTKRDLLHPATFRSVLELIRGIMSKHDFVGLRNTYTKLTNHLNNFEDPHHDSRYGFLNELINDTYAIYVHMSATPLSLADFKTQIVPTLAFVELFRRICLNRYVYDQIKHPDGTVPMTANAYLTEDWGYTGIQTGVVTLKFRYVLQDEFAFIRLGWSEPYSVVFNANGINQPIKTLPVIFEASADDEYINGVSGSKTIFPLPIASNDFTISLQLVGTPASPQNVFSAKSNTDTLSVIANSDQTVSLLINGVVQLKTVYPVTNGHVEIVVSTLGYLSLETLQAGVFTQQVQMPFFFVDNAPLQIGTIGIPFESLTQNGFGLRSLTILGGCKYIITQPDIAVPAGCVLLTDPDGNVLFDLDGTPLVDYDITIPDGYTLMIDDDGSFLIDDDNSFLIDSY